MPSAATESADHSPAFPTERKQQGLRGATDWLALSLGPDSAFTSPPTGHASYYTLMLLGQNIRPLGGCMPCQAPRADAQKVCRISKEKTANGSCWGAGGAFYLPAVVRLGERRALGQGCPGCCGSLKRDIKGSWALNLQILLIISFLFLFSFLLLFKNKSLVPGDHAPGFLL